MPTITIHKKINAHRETVFDIMTKREELAKTIPEYLESVRTRSRRGNVSVIEERLHIADERLVMMTKHVMTRPERHETFVIGGDAKGSRIIETYAVVPGGTLVTITAMIRLGWARRIARMHGGGSFLEGFSAMMDEVATVAEG